MLRQNVVSLYLTHHFRIRSVAEMVLGQLLLLLRRIPEANMKHTVVFGKQAKGCLKRVVSVLVLLDMATLVLSWGS